MRSKKDDLADFVDEHTSPAGVPEAVGDDVTAPISVPPEVVERCDVVTTTGRYRLVVFAKGIVQQTYPLPDAGTVTIGRNERNTIRIRDHSISRKHAVLRIGPTITVEDLGSANGTHVRDQRLAPHEMCEVVASELITLGSMTALIQARFAPAHTCHIATHDYFEARIAEECARADRHGARFAMIRIRVSRDAPDETVLETLAAGLRHSDVLARFGPGEYEVLLVGEPQTEQVARRLLDKLARRAIQGSHRAVEFPRDGRSAYALMTRVGEDPRANDEPDQPVITEPAMRNLYQLVDRIAVSDLCVLVLGETGVGKEMVSQTVHSRSARARKPFVAINCAALNDALLESELFGHEKGSFTGANATTPGLLESAAGGTVLLDEVGDMSLAIQAKLLRVIEENQVRRVGAIKPRKLDVRFIAATNCDIESATARGRFREDLYFRLSAATLVIPPLRERPGEIAQLARRFAGGRELTDDAMLCLTAYSWPGNIRELRNVIERAVLLCGPGPITSEHLPTTKMSGTIVARTSTGPQIYPPRNADAERRWVTDAMERAGGNQRKAAEFLGISRRTLINRLEQFELPRPRKGRKD